MQINKMSEGIENLTHHPQEDLKTNSINTIEEQRAKESALKAKRSNFLSFWKVKKSNRIFYFMEEHLLQNTHNNDNQKMKAKVYLLNAINKYSMLNNYSNFIYSKLFK
jgi:hypothetical protein